MSKIEYIACMDLRNKLKDRVNGNIFISIKENDTLLISIRSYRGLRFIFTYPNISYEIIGKYFMNPDKIINKFLNDYKNYLEKIYFRRQTWVI